jgi:phospholipid-binding lipoprotein MlaA
VVFVGLGAACLLLLATTTRASGPQQPEPALPEAASAVPSQGFDIELEFASEPTSFPDPYERLNRGTFALHQGIDGWVIGPVARGYGHVTPSFVKAGVRNFFANLDAPADLVNDLLQGEWLDAGSTLARFTINTVAGVGGLFDTAAALGIEPHDSDFGQTLAKTGVGSGPYLVVPLLGPTTVRDGFGALVDAALNPTIYLVGPSLILVSASIEAGGTGLAEREARDEDLRLLEETSVDHYAALRNAYYQNRQAQLERRDTADPAT